MMKISFLITGIFSLSLVACSEQPYITYETAQEARLEGAIQRGWLPSWLPDDAYEIHENHNLDTNIRAFSFRLPNSSEFFWPEQCKSIQGSKKPSLKTKLFPKNIHTLPNVKKCDDLIVVKDDSNTMHAWSYRS